MLSIKNSSDKLPRVFKQLSTVKMLDFRPHHRTLNRILVGFLIFVVLGLFLPWTQNISGNGAVTTLRLDQRPQTIHAAIAGRIEKWYVKEGDFVQKGDTIIFLSEIKEEYLDPNLVENTGNQVTAKKQSSASYKGKVGSLGQQIKAIEAEKQLKLQQAKNKIKQALLKIKSDSMDLEAVKTQLKIAKTQFNRSLQLNQEGLKPMTDVEEKKLKLQEVEAKIITQENKFMAANNEWINAKVEINRIRAEYDEKSSKAEGEQYTALSNHYDAETQVSKLKNQYQNYKIRNGLYFICAPQTGYINRALKSGLGETLKEGTELVSIMPAQYELAVETYVEPMDLPLLHRGEKVRVWFDGWPTIVFSGWPGMSYGTFGGKVVAIETVISDNGKYRVLVAPDPAEAAWPKQVQVGTGAQSLALLENVPVWFEIWRNLNGFPPNYYTPKEGKNPKKSEKK